MNPLQDDEDDEDGEETAAGATTENAADGSAVTDGKSDEASAASTGESVNNASEKGPGTDSTGQFEIRESCS